MVAPRRDPLVQAREFSLAGLCGALGLLLPIGFHALGWAGKVFLPMHLPLLVAAFLVGPGLAAALGATVPLLSGALTGMPPLSPPVALLMAAELAAKGATASLLYRRLGAPLWVALAAALVVDWVVLAVAAAGAGRWLGIEAPPLVYVGGVIVLSAPGSVLQVVAVPLGVGLIKRRVPALERRQKAGKG